MRIILGKFREVSQKYPVVRGMASYAVIWPTASLIQQKVLGEGEISYTQALRFSLYGGFFVAPTLYCWLKCASYFWPKQDLRSAITKALVEQVTYSPTAMCCFFFGINFLEFKPISECIDQVKEKFWPTYKIGVCVWPVLQTINFFFVPEHNRVVYVSFCSLMWTSFLAYMKSVENKQKLKLQQQQQQQQLQVLQTAASNINSSQKFAAESKSDEISKSDKDKDNDNKPAAGETTNDTKKRVPVSR